MKTLAKKPESKSKNQSPFFNRKGAVGFLGIQAKLNFGKSGDKYEKEADKVADRVVEHSQNEGKFFSPVNQSLTVQKNTEKIMQEKPLAESITPYIQKKEEVQAKKEEKEESVQKKKEEKIQTKKKDKEEPVQKKDKEEVQAKTEDKEEPVQKKEEEKIQKQEDEEEPIQKKEEEQLQPKLDDKKEKVQKQEEEQTAPADTAVASPDIESTLQQSNGIGSPLPGDYKTKVESQFGVSLGGVQIHTDSNAVNMNKELHSQAFTNNNHIYFNEGKFNPQSKPGQHLLAHELTHTVQQGAVPINSKKEKSEDPGPGNSTAPVAESMGIPLEQNTPAESPFSTAEIKEKETSANDLGANEAQNGNTKKLTDKSKGDNKASSVDDNGKEAGSDYPKSPKEDPTFKSAQIKIKKEAKNQQNHKPSGIVSQAAQDAAPSPENERESQAQAGQVNSMDQQNPGEFSAEAFKAKLMQRISSMQLPQNAEQADNFEDNNNIKEVNQAAKQDVTSEKNNAAGAIEQATTTEPDPQSVPAREVKPLPEPDVCETPKPVGADQAMPKSRPASQVNQPLNDNMQEVNQKMTDNEVTDEQLSKANEPTFSAALNSKNEAKANTESAPAQFRQQEGQTLSASQQQAQTTSQAQMQGMQSDRDVVMNQVGITQGQTGTMDTAERTRIANEINALYEKTKTDVELILSTLDESVSTMFTNAADRAKEKFETHVKERMSAYKSERYSGFEGKLRWLKDKFKGLPSEVNVFFTEGRKIYIDEMDAELTLISQHVAQKLTEAKNRITLGKQQVADYVKALPESLQSIGKEAAGNIQNKFNELEENVNSKQDELIDSLATQYTQSLQEVDARIEEMKAANRGLIDMALDAVKGVIETIIKIKNTLLNILSSAISVIKTIIADPIGFLGNLISGIATGFKNFGSNILKHLTSGLIGWLTGALGPMGITIPEDIFSLKGIFSLVMQILGLTWDYIRKKAVKLLGEPIVAGLEKGFEIFQIIRKEGIAGLWNYIKEQFNDLKETVLGAIKEMVITKVIEAGIKWVLGLMSPAGAFVKAAMMIIDIVKFFVERGSQIIELVSAFIEGVKAVASGSVAKVATAIENALAKALPVVIGFLAALLGIGGLAAKVQKLIKKIRKRIDTVIDKVILKAKKWFKKAGAKIKGAAAKFFKWWKNKKSFKGKDGKKHKLYFKGEGKSAALTIASDPTPLTTFLKSVNTGGNAEKEGIKTQALGVSTKIDSLKSTPISGGNETEKNLKSKEVDDSVKAKMETLVPLINKLMGGEEKSVEILKQYLSKKVTNKDDTVNKNFINAFTTDKNKVNGKMVYVYRDDMIVRGPNKAQEGYMSVFINEEGILLPGAEKKYVAPHTLFNPEKMVISLSNGVYKATYETDKTSGSGKQKYTVDIKYEQIEQKSDDHIEQRTVKGENMVKKPGGMQRGKTDSAGSGFDNAHLIGDRFGGSGYNQGLSIYPSSENYNRDAMLKKEDALFNNLKANASFEMKVSAKINHTADVKGTNDNKLKALLNDEFKNDNGGAKSDIDVQEGMTKKLRSSIAADIKDVPGRFDNVTYSVNQNGKSFPESVGTDGGYGEAVKKKLGTK